MMIENEEIYLVLVLIAILVVLVIVGLWVLILHIAEREGKERSRFLKHLVINAVGFIIPPPLFYLLIRFGIVDPWNTLTWLGLIAAYGAVLSVVSYLYNSDPLVTARGELIPSDEFGIGTYTGGLKKKDTPTPAYCFEMRESFIITDYNASFIGEIKKKSITKTLIEERHTVGADNGKPSYHLILELEHEGGLTGRAAFVFTSKTAAINVRLSICRSCLYEEEKSTTGTSSGSGISLLAMSRFTDFS